MKNLGEIKEYLGINIKYDFRNCDMELSQTKYMSNSAVLLLFELLFDIFRYTHYTEFCIGYSS